MANKYTIGRDPDNSIVVSSTYPRVSGKHATFWVNGNEVIFEDHSRNGSSVNGHRVHNSKFYIQKGDELILAGGYKVNLLTLPFVCGQEPINIHSFQCQERKLTSRKVNVGYDTNYISSLEQSLPFVYYIEEYKRVVNYRGEKREIDCGGCATSFLLSDGRFVTARHVVEPWMFINQSSDETDLTLNLVANHGGSVVSYFRAYNCKGDKFSFTTKSMEIFRGADFVTDLGDRQFVQAGREHDWAYIQTRHQGGLNFDVHKSVSLKILTKLTILGFPFGFGANSVNDIQPIYGSATVAKTGLENGVILTTEDSTDLGNSGGPVFYSHADGTLSVIGIVSAGRGSHIGMMIPIYNIYSQHI